MTYAKYLMCVHLGRMLNRDEEVDHIDEDKTNDVISNLQILTRAQNTAKNLEHRKNLGLIGLRAVIDCAQCLKSFVRPLKTYEKLIAEGKEPTCSRSCSVKRQHALGLCSPKIKKKAVTPEQSALILELRGEGKSDYTISEMIGLSRAMIQRYRSEQGIE